MAAGKDGGATVRAGGGSPAHRLSLGRHGAGQLPPGRSAPPLPAPHPAATNTRHGHCHVQPPECQARSSSTRRASSHRRKATVKGAPKGTSLRDRRKRRPLTATFPGQTSAPIRRTGKLTAGRRGPNRSSGDLLRLAGHGDTKQNELGLLR